jgi:deoxyribonuclease-1
MSWVTRALNCGRRKACRETSPRFNRIEADLHNLYPARADVNDARGSFRFGEISGERRVFGDCDFEFDARQRAVEPRPASRGEIARAMFYMHRQYGLTLFRRQGEMLLRWHRQDPPGAEERRRNGRIEQIQGNRNPYIDSPALADELRF